MKWMMSATSTLRLSVEADKRLQAVVETHYDFLWRSLRRLGVPEAEVEDAAQKVLIVFLRRIESVRSGAERSFLFGIALRVAHKARRPPAAPLVGLDATEHVPDPARTPDAALDETRMRRILDLALADLADDLRAVFVLADLEEMTAAEIADALEIPAGTVASRLRRARELFAKNAARWRTRLEGTSHG
jgi:RNA polymerase sigma-70 factor (ECF subfamily)